MIEPSEYELTLSERSFNDAYRYMGWLLVVPLLLVELALVMKLPSWAISSRLALVRLSPAVISAAEGCCAGVLLRLGAPAAAAAAAAAAARCGL